MYADIFHEGWAAVYYSNESNYINTSDKSLLAENIEGFAIMEPFSDGIAIIHKSLYGKHSFYDTYGVILFNLDIFNTPKFSDGMTEFNDEGYALAYTIVDKNESTQEKLFYMIHIEGS